MAEINDLKTKIEVLIKDNNFDIEKLRLILHPISLYVTNPVFVHNINEIVDIIIVDRNGDHQFNIADLQILSKDPIAIMSLVSAVMLIVSAIPTTKLQYNQGATEELIFKLLAYIFLVIVPSKIATPLTLEEKDAILNLTLVTYETLKSSQMVQNIISEVIAKMKSKGWCNCLIGPTDANQDKLDKHLPMAKLNLSQSVNNIRIKSQLNNLTQNFAVKNASTI